MYAFLKYVTDNKLFLPVLSSAENKDDKKDNVRSISSYSGWYS